MMTYGTAGGAGLVVGARVIDVAWSVAVVAPANLVGPKDLAVGL